MDRSSPLAAMPPPAAFSALFRARSHTHQVSLPSVRDFDSPTSTLAADLSQNFHINRSSPVTATPRRSLMQSFSFGKPACDKTPPVNLHSSPSADGSDLSPLPHKPLARNPYALKVIFCYKAIYLAYFFDFILLVLSDRDQKRKTALSLPFQPLLRQTLTEPLTRALTLPILSLSVLMLQDRPLTPRLLAASDRLFVSPLQPTQTHLSLILLLVLRPDPTAKCVAPRACSKRQKNL